MIRPQGIDKLFDVHSQLTFLYECFSQPTGPLELSDEGQEGLTTWIGTLADQAEEVTEELMARGKNKKEVKVK